MSREKDGGLLSWLFGGKKDQRRNGEINIPRGGREREEVSNGRVDWDAVNADLDRKFGTMRRGNVPSDPIVDYLDQGRTPSNLGSWGNRDFEGEKRQYIEQLKKRAKAIVQTTFGDIDPMRINTAFTDNILISVVQCRDQFLSILLEEFGYRREDATTRGGNDRNIEIKGHTTRSGDHPSAYDAADILEDVIKGVGIMGLTYNPVVFIHGGIGCKVNGYPRRGHSKEVVYEFTIDRSGNPIWKKTKNERYPTEDEERY